MDIKGRKAWIYIVFLFALVFGAFTGVSTRARQGKSLGQNNERLNELMEAVKSGKIAKNLTDPNEIKAILGEPESQERKGSGGMLLLNMYFPNNVEVRFSKFKKFGGPFTLGDISINGKWIELDEEELLVLRTTQDLKKLSGFTGLQSVSLKKLDLTKEYDNFKNFNFDSLTQWPGREKLPAGFNPHKLLEDGKNPGLGICALHEEGINGEGIGIAILDQLLLLGHEEYTSRLIRYDSTEANWRWWREPAMHGSPIVSIAVGKTCGVAPRAFVFYYAAGSTSGKAQIQADWINEIIKYNETAEDPKRIRVINISAAPDRALVFREARKKALDAGILVVTCSRKFLDYGTLNLIEGKDPDDAESYIPGGYSGSSDVLRVPVGNGTTASHRGINVYTYYRQGGMSWAAPYIAGLAALAFQVNPELQPQTIVERLVKTATHTKAGPVVNPRGFIESVKRSK
ncbi:MAG: S8 family serine peptidase [Planctomycetota bacterium]|jgi:hypothetical protein